MRGALSALSSKGTVSAFASEAQHLSPALGLAALHGHVFIGNLRRSRVTGGCRWGLGPSSELTHAIFTQQSRGDPVRATRSRSQAAAHLRPDAIGVVLGLGISRARPEYARQRLQRCGIETNRVRGEWTGVSLARYKRLVELIAAGSDDAAAARQLASVL